MAWFVSKGHDKYLLMCEWLNSFSVWHMQTFTHRWAAHPLLFRIFFPLPTFNFCCWLNNMARTAALAARSPPPEPKHKKKSHFGALAECVQQTHGAGTWVRCRWRPSGWPWAWWRRSNRRWGPACPSPGSPPGTRLEFPGPGQAKTLQQSLKGELNGERIHQISHRQHIVLIFVDIHGIARISRTQFFPLFFLLTKCFGKKMFPSTCTETL